jgi:hypothetical protein
MSSATVIRPHITPISMACDMVEMSLQAPLSCSRAHSQANPDTCSNHGIPGFLILSCSATEYHVVRVLYEPDG